MAGERERVVRRAFEAWNARDHDGLLGLYAPDVEVDLGRMDLPDAQVLEGREAVREFVVNLVDYFSELRFEVTELREHGDWVVSRGAMRGRLQTGGLEVEQEFSDAALVRAGEIERDVYFAGREAAARWVERNAPALLVSAANVSEGRDLAVVERLEGAVGPARVLDVHADPDHNRSVLTLAARQGELAAGLLGLARAAVEEIDLRTHTGVHPQVGALDVMPVVWWEEGRRGAATAEALTAAALVGEDAGLPVFLYGELATRPEHVERATIRRGGPRELARRMEAGELVPDYGPKRAHPSAGAVLATARPPLLAFNVDLATGDLELARAIAAELRESNGGLPGVRALGLYLDARGRAQVSTNVHDHCAVPLREIVARVRARAPVAEAELIGLAPRAAFEGFPEDVPLRGFLPERHILEEALGALDLDRAGEIRGPVR